MKGGWEICDEARMKGVNGGTVEMHTSLYTNYSSNTKGLPHATMKDKN